MVPEGMDVWTIVSNMFALPSLIVSAFAYQLSQQQAASADSRAIYATLSSARTKLSETAIHIGDSVSLVRVYEIEQSMVEGLRGKAAFAGLPISREKKESDSSRYKDAIHLARNLHHELSRELNSKRAWTQVQASALMENCEETRGLAALAAASLRTTNADVARLRNEFEERLTKLSDK